MVDGALVHSGQDHARRNAVYGNALGSQFKRESGGELGEPPLCRILIDAAGPRCAFVDGGTVDYASFGSRPVPKIGRASWWGRVGEFVYISVVAGFLKKKKKER